MLDSFNTFLPSGILERMWEIKFFLEAFDNYTRNKKAHLLYDDSVFRSMVKSESLFLFLVNEKRFFLKPIDRFRVRIKRMMGLKKIFGNRKMNADNFGAYMNLKHYDFSTQIFRDMVNECESRGFIEKNYDTITLLQPGRKFLRPAQFANEMAKEFKDLISVLSLLGLGSFLYFVISHHQEISGWFRCAFGNIC